jgi:hypothetical protein
VIRGVPTLAAQNTGSVLIDGRKYWLNGWVKDGRDGKKFLSLSVRPAEQANHKPSAKGDALAPESEAAF